MTDRPTLLSATGITKYFGSFAANDGVALTVREGEIHALLGENGAGKSTLVKMLYGVMQPDAGQFQWQGNTSVIASPRDARAMGIAMVFQHFSLFPALTVAENIALALDGSMKKDELHARIISESARWGLEIDPSHPVGTLSVGEQQRVEIIRCLLQNPKLLIMDEPTSVLTPQEAQSLFDVLRRLAEEGCAILYISHKLNEVIELADTATVLRGGHNVGHVTPKDSSTRELAEMMVGTGVDWVDRRETMPDTGAAASLMQVRHLSRPASHDFATTLQDISFDLRPGEILGIAGVSGNGQEELAEALSGEWRCPDASMIQFKGNHIGQLNPLRRRQHGLESIPEERNGHAAVPDMPLSDNTFLTHFSRYGRGFWLKRLLTNPLMAAQETRAIIADSDVRIPHENPLASRLSGGNLQKFIMGRMLKAAPNAAVVVQPTWGVDVGAASAIRRSLLALAEGGCGIILISQDLEEIFSLASHIAVLHQGRLSPVQPALGVTAEEIGLLMGGMMEPAAGKEGAA